MSSARKLSTPGFDEEIRTYLQQRLRLLAGAVTVITGVLAAAFVVAKWQRGDDSVMTVLVAFVTTLPNAALFWLVVGASVIRRGLQSRRLSERGLAMLDGLLLQILVASCLLLYASSHTFSFSGFALVLPFLTLFILTRATLVPSSAARTFWLSIPAPLGCWRSSCGRGHRTLSPIRHTHAATTSTF